MEVEHGVSEPSMQYMSYAHEMFEGKVRTTIMFGGRPVGTCEWRGVNAGEATERTDQLVEQILKAHLDSLTAGGTGTGERDNYDWD